MAAQTLRRRLRHGDVDGRINEHMDTSGLDDLNEPLLGNYGFGGSQSKEYDDRNQQDILDDKKENLHWSFLFSQLVAQWAQWLANIFVGSGSVLGRFIPIPSVFQNGQDHPTCLSPLQADPNMDVRGRMINAGILIIDKHGKENVALLFPIFDSYLNKKSSDEEMYDLVREGVVIFTGALAKHLAQDDPKVHTVVEKLLDVLDTPSEAVQRAVSDCLSPLMKSKHEDGEDLVKRLLDRMMKSDRYGERRGAAFGLAGVVKGFRISCIKKYGIAATLTEGLADRFCLSS